MVYRRDFHSSGSLCERRGKKTTSHPILRITLWGALEGDMEPKFIFFVTDKDSHLVSFSALAMYMTINFLLHFWTLQIKLSILRTVR